jgi:mRNA interferase YafQ
MSFTIGFSGQFKKDVKLCKKRNYDLLLLQTVFDKLKENGELPAIYRPHILSGNYSGYWECHIKPDWIMLWLQNNDKKEIYLERTGTHSDLFK